jgi:hypothetical protein
MTTGAAQSSSIPSTGLETDERRQGKVKVVTVVPRLRTHTRRVDVVRR